MPISETSRCLDETETETSELWYRDETETRPRRDRDETETRPRRDEAETRPRRDRDEAETKPRRDRDETKTRPRRDRDNTETRPRRDRDKTEMRPKLWKLVSRDCLETRHVSRHYSSGGDTRHAGYIGPHLAWYHLELWTCQQTRFALQIPIARSLMDSSPFGLILSSDVECSCFKPVHSVIILSRQWIVIVQWSSNSSMD